MSQSQVAVTKTVRDSAKDIPGERLEFLNNAAEKVHLYFKRIHYDDQTKAAEAAIRWRRTASQIIEGGFVYSGKSCTDEVIAYIAVCRARAYDARFVKLKLANGNVHSVAEVQLPDGWYVVDVSAGISAFKSAYEFGKELDGALLWKKGRDAWDVGLNGIHSRMDGKTIT